MIEVGKNYYSENKMYYFTLVWEFDIPRYRVFKKREYLSFFLKKKKVIWEQVTELYIGSARNADVFESRKKDTLECINYLERCDLQKQKSI